MKKRILGIILTISMVCSLFAVGASAEEAADEAAAAAAPAFTDISGLPCETAVNALAAAGIVNGRSEGIYAPNEGLTRAEMTAIILRGFGSEEIEDIEKFKDVPTTHWAYMYVETAYKMGIVNGMTATTFVPDGSVTYEQAVKMLVCAAGKGSKAETEGGWPDGYIKVAGEMGTLEGVGGQIGEAISRGVMAQLVHNFLGVAEDEFSYMYDWDNGVVEDHYLWIRDEKFRGVYGGMPVDTRPDTGIDLKIFADVGCNVGIYNLLAAGYDYKTFEGAKKILEDAKPYFENSGMRTFIKINFGDNGVAKFADYRMFHPGIYKSKYSTTTCPLDQAYWDKQLYERSLYIATLPYVEGLVLDFEMYYGDSSYSSSCKCDYCWSEYIKDRRMGSEWNNVEITERSAFLNSKNAVDDYALWMEGRLTKMFASLREQIHAINPKLILGTMPGVGWIQGIAQGLGTPERPVLNFSEKEYWGSLANATNSMASYKKKGWNVIYVPGLYPGKSALSPEDLEKNMGLVSTTTAGYWLYNASSTIAVEENFAALERGNALLTERTKNGELVPFPTYDVNSYSAKKIQGSEPTGEEWAAAADTEEFIYYKKGDVNKALVKTKAKILYSDKELFVRVIAYGDPSEITQTTKGERDSDVWDGPNVEIFWKIEDTNDAWHFAADAAGTIWDGYSSGIGTQDKSQTLEGVEANTEIFDDRWEMTLRFPISTDGVRYAKKGDVLKMEISRYHLPSIEAGFTGYLVWAPTYSSFMGTQALWGTVNLD